MLIVIVLPLAAMITLFTAVLSIFTALFVNAIRLVLAGQGEEMLPYLLVGVSGIFATEIVGLPLIIV